MNTVDCDVLVIGGGGAGVAAAALAARAGARVVLVSKEPAVVSMAKKGQIFLNGRNAGRFWNIGPQEEYYLPEPWLGEDNELLIFEEQGNIPSGSRLAFRPQGPYGL